MTVQLRISDTRLDELIAEDVPYFDLTTHILGIGDMPGSIEYFTRETCILCGTEEVVRMMERLGLAVEHALPSGTPLEPGQTFLRAQGSTADLHAAWKVCLNVLDHCSAVATKTRTMVDAAHAVNPECQVLTTRKSMPGSKILFTKAVMTGGALPHRLGLSETVLVFAQHIEFMGGFEAFVSDLPAIRQRCSDKSLVVEANGDQALTLVRAGVDAIQFDKVPSEQLTPLVHELRAIDPHITLIAAGGVNPQNAAQYAATGVDALATTALFTAKPVDMGVRMFAD